MAQSSLFEPSPGGPRFSPLKAFIRPIGVESEWKELHGLIPSRIIVEETSRTFVPKIPPRAGRIVMKLTATISDDTIIKLKKMAGLPTRPKCTYKTIKRGCAKRNRYKR